ncbi:MAG: type 1 glutamine amidotransferase [Betaproteobacteria bacterium]|nr:type 1 glutamine amidotransferase [Betaproteobacteria bacterium]
MRAHWFQHVAFEGLGSIAGWLAARGIETTCTRFDQAAKLPELADLDWLIVMGGPMSVNDEHLHPWLADEKRFVRDAMAAGRRVLGICLGAQLMASALGARVYPNAAREIGWHPIDGVAPPAGRPAFRFPAQAPVFHWHGETFELPAGSVHSARSVGCEHQAFQLGARAIGLQFHLEMTPAGAAALVANCPGDLRPGSFVQSEQAMLSAPPRHYQVANALMGDVLDYLAGGER